MIQVMPVSVETISKLVGLDVSVISSTLTEEKEGVKVPISNQKLIDKTFEDALNKKLNTLNADSEERHKREGRKEAYAQFEDEAKSIGVEMKWTDDKLSKLQTHFTKVAPNPETKEIDLTKDERVIRMIQDHDKALKVKDQEYQTQIAELNKLNTVDKVRRWSLEQVTNKDSGLTQYAKPVAINLNNLAVDSTIKKIESMGLKIDVKNENGNDVFTLIDSEGKPYRDPNNSYAEVSFSQFHLENAQQGFFPVMAAPSISSGGAGTSQSKVFTRKVGEKEQEWKLPDLKNMTQVEYSKWTMENQDAPTEMLSEANKVYFNKE